MKKSVVIVTFFCLWFSFAFATPNPTSYSGSPGHKNTIVLTGSGFSAKPYAKPIIWDDAEDATVDTAPSTSTAPNSLSRYHYTEVLPPTTLDDPWKIRYRSFPITPIGAGSVELTPIQAPHSHSTKGISGGHQNGIGGDGNDGANVMLTVGDPGGLGTFSSDWIFVYYLKYSYEWAACSTSNNHKFLTIQAGTQAFSNSPYSNHFMYWDFGGSPTNPCANSGYVSTESQSFTGLTESVNHGKIMPDTFTPWDKIMGIRDPDTQNDSPKDKYVHVMVEISERLGFVKITFNNVPAWWGSNHIDWFPWEGIGSVSIGTYFRQTSTPNEENDNNHNIFDDIYVDNSLARVVLGNNASLPLCTIIEPQIATAWADGEITLQMNLGALSDTGTVYLFVYDVDGNVNSTGLEIPLDAVILPPYQSFGGYSNRR